MIRRVQLDFQTQAGLDVLDGGRLRLLEDLEAHGSLEVAVDAKGANQPRADAFAGVARRQRDTQSVPLIVDTGFRIRTIPLPFLLVFRFAPEGLLNLLPGLGSGLLLAGAAGQP